MYVETALEAQFVSFEVWLCKKALQGLEMSPQALGYSQQTENQRHEFHQLLPDLLTIVKKRTQRSDDSILLRHMDDVVGTGPEEHLHERFWGT